MTTLKMKILLFLLVILLTISLFPTAALCATEGDYIYSDNGDGTCTITGYIGTCGDVVIPGTLDGFSVTAIGDLAFDKAGLTSVTIPDSVKTIGQYTFATNFLTSVNFGIGLQTIGKWAFMANSLSSVTLPSSLTELSLEAFLNSGLSEITLPHPEEGYISTWKKGPGTVFHGGDSVPVGDSYTRTSYERIFEYNVYDEFLKLITISAYNGLGGDVVIPSTIDGYTVYGIEYRAFAGKGITSVTLPDCVMFLQTGVFADNPGLTSFNLPGAYKGYVNGWYEYKTGTIKRSCGDEVTDLKDANYRAEYEFSVHPDGSAIINNCNAEYTDIHVPADFESLSTGYIGDYAFFGNYFSGDLVIPDGVKSISFAAFADNELTSVTLPNSVKKIDTYAFFMNPEISSFYLPSGPVGYTSIWREIDPGSDVMSTDDDTIIGERRSSKAVTNLANGFEWLRHDINQYTVTFKDFNNSIIRTVTQDYKTALTYPEYPTREGYTLSGWSHDITTIPAQDVTITAVYTVNEYTATFIDFDGSVIKTVKQNYNTILNYPEDPFREGFSFSGWSSNFSAIPAQDVVITATYTESPQNIVQRGTITGTLIDNDGKPLAGQTVALHSEPITVKTDNNGRFAFIDVTLTDHTLILNKANGAEIGRYSLSFMQSADASYTVSNTDVDVKVTASTVVIDILINLNSTGTATIQYITFSENPQTGDSPNFLICMWISIIMATAVIVTIIFRRRSLSN